MSRRQLPRITFVLFTLLIILSLASAALAYNVSPTQEVGAVSPQEQTPDRESQLRALLADRQAPLAAERMSATPCVGGFAGAYPCENVDLLAFMPLAAIGGGNGNDIWGWTDPLTDKEYALMGRSSGTAFVDISDPENPVYLGNLPTHTSNSSWRDIKVYANHAFIVSEASGHGMQVFDLTRLRSVSSPPVTFTSDAHYGEFGSAHNIVINEATGFAYAVGAGSCSAGLHMIDISAPTSPVFAGCFSSDGYTHDAQCVVYDGPDVAHQGQEICFNSNEDTLTIVNVTNKSSPVQLSRTGYSGRGYTHQGWLTEDHTYFLLNDEGDEQSYGHNTRTRIWDVSDLEAPAIIGIYDGPTPAIDHNLYVKGDYAYEANYRAGLRIVDISDIAAGNLAEAAYFDVYPSSNSPNFNGSWSNYPYFDSGVVIVSGIEQGLFVLRPTLAPDFSLSASPASLAVCAPDNAAYNVAVDSASGFTDPVTLSASGNPAGTTVGFSTNPVTPPGSSVLTIGNTGAAAAGSYTIDIAGAAGPLTHSTAVELDLATAAPGTPTLTSPANGATGVSTMPTLQWTAAAGAVEYYVEVATDAGFSNVVYSATASGTSHTVGSALAQNTTHYWRVTARNACGDGSPATAFSFTTQGGGCVAEVALTGKAGQSDLAALRQFRDEVLAASPAGQAYIELYYEHSPELVWMLLKDAELRARTAAVLGELMPGIRDALGQAGGAATTFDAARIKRIDGLLAAYAERGSPELGEALRGLQDEVAGYEGRTLRQVWGSATR